MAGCQSGQNDGGGSGSGELGCGLGFRTGRGREALRSGRRAGGCECRVSRREEGREGGMSCWGASLREIGGSQRSRRVRGRERQGVDDIGEMGEWGHAGLRRGGSRCALGWKGLVSRTGPKSEHSQNKGGSTATVCQRKNQDKA